MIKRFEKEYDFLSNFYPCRILYNRIFFPTVENAFQAAKYVGNQRMTVYRQFASLTPGQAKFKGRRIPLRNDWDAIRIDVMEELLRIKFSDPVLKRKLLDTGEQVLIEGNFWHDNFWGSCICSKCRDHGQNHLGQLLMKLRTEFNINRS